MKTTFRIIGIFFLLLVIVLAYTNPVVRSLSKCFGVANIEFENKEIEYSRGNLTKEELNSYSQQFVESTEKECMYQVSEETNRPIFIVQLVVDISRTILGARNR